jgi:hypothetical protein
VRKPRNYWKSRKNRVRAVRTLAGRLGKVTYRDFERNGLGAVLEYYGRSARKALLDAGCDAGGMRAPRKYWKSRVNRIRAVRNLVKRRGSLPTYRDFQAAGLTRLLDYYGDSPRKAVEDAGFDAKGMRVPPNYWSKRENRLKALRALGIPLKELTSNKLKERGLRGVLRYYGNSIFNIVDELMDGRTYRVWQVRMSVPYGYWRKRSNRINALKWLLSATKKHAWELTGVDFNRLRLGGLLNCYNHKRVAEKYGMVELYERFDEWQMRALFDMRGR